MMTGVEIEMLQSIGKIPVQVFTITAAQDWPMFLTMMKVLAVVVAVAWGSCVALGVYIWKDLQVRISAQRKEDAERCEGCKTSIWEHIDGPLWSAIKDCCSFMSPADKEELKAKIKQHAGEGEKHHA